MRTIMLVLAGFIMFLPGRSYSQQNTHVLEKLLKEKFLAPFNNIKMDRQGNYLVTGFFEDSLNIGNKVVHSRGMSDVFIARFDKDLKLEWIKLAGGNHVDIIRLMHTDMENNIYVSGLFKGLVYWEDTIIQSPGQYNYFTAKYNDKGDLLWIKQNRLIK
jgi:hypothetical protein